MTPLPDRTPAEMVLSILLSICEVVALTGLVVTTILLIADAL